MTWVFILANSEDKKGARIMRKSRRCHDISFWSRGNTTSKGRVSGWTRGISKACAIGSKAGDKVEMIEMWSYLDRSTILDTATQRAELS